MVTAFCPTASIANSNANDGGKERPDELNIKPFVSGKPLPVPTPSREATLTQKLEQVQWTARDEREELDYYLHFIFPGPWLCVPTPA